MRDTADRSTEARLAGSTCCNNTLTIIEVKQHGKSIEIGTEPRRAPIIDMMTALKKSLAATSAALAEKKRGSRTAKRNVQTVSKAS